MFCSNCGRELADGSAFCAGCGASLQNPPVEQIQTEVQAEGYAQNYAQSYAQNYDQNYVNNQVVEEASLVEEVGNEGMPMAAPYVEGEYIDANMQQPYFAQPQFAPPPKKPKKVLIAIISIFLVFALLITTVAVCADSLKGFFIKTIGSDADYFLYVESNSINSIVTDFSEIYGNVLDNLNPKAGAEASFKLNVGDKAVSLLEDTLKAEMGSEIDLSWLNTVSLDMNINAKENLEKIVAALKLNDKELVKLDAIMDMDKGDIFIALLSMSEKYLKSNTGIDADYSESLGLITSAEFKKAIPAEKELDKLLKKYIEIALKNLDNVKKGSDVLLVGGIEQKLTTLELKIGEKELKKVATAILEEMKDDKQVKKYIEDIALYLASNDIIPTSDKVYDNFRESIEDALEDIEKSKTNSSEAIYWTDYVNSKHEVVGRKIEFAGYEALDYVVVRNGKEFAFELNASDVVVSGKGTEKGDIVNGEFGVQYSGQEICTLAVTDFNIDSEYINGKFRVKPSSELLKNMGLDSGVSSLLSIVSPELELNFETSEKSAKIDVNLISSEEVFLGFTISVKETKAEKIELPSSKDVYEEENADEWLETIDMDALLKKFEEAGVPSDLVNTLKGLVNMVNAPSSSNYDSFDFEY